MNITLKLLVGSFARITGKARRKGIMMLPASLRNVFSWWLRNDIMEVV